MAGDFGSRVLYRKDERGVIVDSGVFASDGKVPDGWTDKAEYTSYVPSATEAPPVAESRLTTWEGVDLSQTVDAIKETAEEQEGPTDPAALRSSGELKGKDKVSVEGTIRRTDEVVAAGDGSAEYDSSQTVDAVKNANDQQEGDTGENSVDEPKSRRAGRR